MFVGPSKRISFHSKDSPCTAKLVTPNLDFTCSLIFVILADTVPLLSQELLVLYTILVYTKTVDSLECAC